MSKDETDRISYLTRQDYLSMVTRGRSAKYWSGYEGRWLYHERAIRILQEECSIRSPEDVLEIGTMGVQIVPGSDTMDFAKRFDYEGKESATNYMHDARSVPWPISDKKYKCCIALRVFHHLAPMQRECFQEARRIAETVIIVAPHSVADTNTQGITPGDWYDFNSGKPPKVMIRTGSGTNYLLFWDKVSLQ